MGQSKSPPVELEAPSQINARKRVYLTATTLQGRFVLRICVLSFRTHAARMEMCLDDIRVAAAELS